jgi:predicted dinucleotide-binding enzyme
MAGMLLATALLGVSGCGGGGDSGSSLTRAEFIKQGNQICRQKNEERVQAKAQKQKELGLQPGEIATPAQHKQIVEATVAPFEEATEELRELVPSDQADKVEPLLAAREELVDVVGKTSATADANFIAIKKANEFAVQFGLDECSV